MRKTRVLFICIHNSARSQMAETFLHDLGGDRFEVESAGLEPREINPLVVEIMGELGYDLSENQADSVFEFFKQGRLYDYVITVCDESTEDRCPLFPGVQHRLHWPFPDPGSLEGTRKEQLEAARKIRDMIRSQVKIWIENLP